MFYVFFSAFSFRVVVSVSSFVGVWLGWVACLDFLGSAFGVDSCGERVLLGVVDLVLRLSVEEKKRVVTVCNRRWRIILIGFVSFVLNVGSCYYLRFMFGRRVFSFLFILIVNRSWVI